MFLIKSCSGDKKSVFLCDRCKVRLLSHERVSVRIHHPKKQTILKKWDLCPICYRKLYKGIEKYKKME